MRYTPCLRDVKLNGITYFFTDAGERIVNGFCARAEFLSRFAVGEPCKTATKNAFFKIGEELAAADETVKIFKLFAFNHNVLRVLFGCGNTCFIRDGHGGCQRIVACVVVKAHCRNDAVADAGACIGAERCAF